MGRHRLAWVVAVLVCIVMMMQPGTVAGPSISTGRDATPKGDLSQINGGLHGSQGAVQNRSTSLSPHCSNCLVKNISVGQYPVCIAFDPVNGYLYVTNQESGNVSVIDGATNEVVASVWIGGYPDGLTYDPSNGDIYALNDDNVSVISPSTNTVIAHVNVGMAPQDVAYNSANTDLYVTNGNSNNVSVINGSSNVVTASIPAGSSPRGIVYDSVNRNIYVMNEGVAGCAGCNVTVISGVTNKAVASIPGENDTADGVVDSTTGDVYVINGGSDYYGPGSVEVVSGATNSIIRHIDKGAYPQRGVFDPANGLIYITNGTLTVINTSINEVMSDFNLGAGFLYGMAYDSANDYIYVAEQYSSMAGAVGVFSPSGSPPFISSFAAFPSPAHLGETTYLNITVSGGTPPYHYYFTGLPKGCATADTESLSCTPTSPGNFTVTVMVNDSLGRVRSASLNINVLMFTLSITPSLYLVHLNETTILSVTVGGDSPPYTFVYGGLPRGCTTLNASKNPCTPTVPGSYTVTVNATDPFGNTLGASVGITVLAGPTVTIVPRLSKVDVGEAVPFQATVSGGASPYSYQFAPSLRSVACGQAMGSSVSCTPSVAGSSFRVLVNATDAFGVVASADSANVTVMPRLMAHIEASNDTPLLGQSLAILANASGGVSPYTYGYSGLPPGCVSVNSSSIGCLPTQSGRYNVSVNVTDIDGSKAFANLSIQVIFGFTVVAPAQATIGEPISIRVIPGGGYGTLTYGYSGLPAGCLSSDSPDLTCTPTQTGQFTIIIIVRDQVGNQAKQTVNLTVTPGPSIKTGFLGLPGINGYLVVGGIAAAVVAGIVFAVWMLRRKPASTVPSPRDKEGETEADFPQADEGQAKTDGNADIHPEPSP